MDFYSVRRRRTGDGKAFPLFGVKPNIKAKQFSNPFKRKRVVRKIEKLKRKLFCFVCQNSAAESEGGQKFLPPNPLPFCPPERSVWRAKRAVSSVQKRFGFRQTNALVISGS